MSLQLKSWRTPTIILIVGCIILSLSMGVRHTAGLFLQPMTTSHEWSRETFSFAIAIQNLVWGLASPFAGALADRHGFIAVYPDSRRGHWDDGRETVTDPTDDVAFIGALLDALAAEYAVDARRIYAAGISNGGMMSMRLACELSGRLAAIAVATTGLGLLREQALFRRGLGDLAEVGARLEATAGAGGLAGTNGHDALSSRTAGFRPLPG